MSGPLDILGKDGFFTGDRKVVGKDIFSMNLNYYEDDYSSNAPGGSPFWNESDPPDNNLYDGNISSWNNKFNRVAYPVADSIDPVLDNYHAQYEYDLAGRLVQSRLDTLSGSTRNSQDKFKTDYFYDLNGNMDTLTRWDNLAMPNGISNLRGTAPITGKPNNRQVFSVQSSPSGGATTFAYDNMGNLVSELNPMVESMNLIRWTADGKLAVTMKNINVTDSITHAVHQLSLYQHYYYDGMGNRVLKIGNGKLDPQEEGMDPILLHCNMDIDGTGCAPCQEDLNVRGYYYAREAGGKVLATYETSPEGVTGQGSSCYAAYYYQDLKEWYIYGSESDGRISVLKPYVNEFTDHLHKNAIHLFDQAEPYAMKDTIIEYQANTIGSFTSNARITGHKEYEIKDHLGNVRVVISDVKNPITPSSSVSSWTFTAEIRNLNNYYPYGMELPGGAYASIGNYTYGYNGMEKDDELKGSGKLYSTLFREGDTENGRWWSRDPKEMSMPYQSPYVLMDANPINMMDLKGDFPFNFSSCCEGTLENLSKFIKNKTKKIVSDLKIIGARAFIGITKIYATNQLDKAVNGDNDFVTSVALTAEFITGLGPEKRVFPENHPFTKSLKDANLTTEALVAFYNGYLEYKAYERPDIPPSYRVDFEYLYGGDTGPFKEFFEDGEFTAAQFTGTANYVFDLDEKNSILNITVYDSKTEYSFLYHAPGTDRHSRDEGKIMGETTQVYTFSFTIEEIEKRVKNENSFEYYFANRYTIY
ncbi:MAG: hypothetical protein WC121_04475 [Candidatus Kapaibacterium sp.]